MLLADHNFAAGVLASQNSKSSETAGVASSLKYRHSSLTAFSRMESEFHVSGGNSFDVFVMSEFRHRACGYQQECRFSRYFRILIAGSTGS